MADTNSHDSNYPNWHATTILCVRKGSDVVVAGDGQVSMGDPVVKANAMKVRPLHNDTVITGFAGATADAFTLFERLEAKLDQHPGQLTRACVELAKDWRTDKILKELDALLAIMDSKSAYLLSGSGDVIEPDDQIISIGSGSGYAVAAARAFIEAGEKDPAKIVKKAMGITANLCIYTNDNITILKA